MTNAELEALARAATPQQWRTGEGIGVFGRNRVWSDDKALQPVCVLVSHSMSPPDIDRAAQANAAHIAAWSPERALAALAVIEAARALRETTAEHWNEATQRNAVALAAWDALNARKP